MSNSCYTARQYIGPGEQSVAGLLPVSTKGLNQNGPGVGFWVDPGIGAAWWSFSSPTNGTLVVMPEGSPTNEDGSPAAYRCSATSGSKSSTESFEWLVDIPSDDSAYGSVLAMPMRSYPSWVRLDVFAGQPVDFVLFGRIGNPFAVRTRFSTGTMIVKQPSQVVRVETGGTAFLASFVAGPIKSPRELGPAWTNQWFKDGLAIAGATNGFLQITNVSPDDAGNHVLAVGSPGGGETSRLSRVEVMDPRTMTEPVALKMVGVSSNGVLVEATSDSVHILNVMTTNATSWPAPSLIPDRWTADALPQIAIPSSASNCLPLRWAPPAFQVLRTTTNDTTRFRMPRPIGGTAFYRAWPHVPADPVCHAQMQRMRRAIQQWGHDSNMPSSAVVASSDLVPYAGQYNIVVRCPKGGTCSTTLVMLPPSCNIYGHGPWGLDW